MSPLIDLPVEILSLILTEVGGRELRRKEQNASRLLVCRKWYRAARPIYLSGLDTTEVLLFGHNLHRLSDRLSYAGLRPIMHKNTRRLHIRLLGHWWDTASSAAAHERSDDDDDEDGDAPLVHNQPPIDFRSESGKARLLDWTANELLPRLDELFRDLGNFTALEHLVFEAASEPESEHGPRLDYLLDSDVTFVLLRNIRRALAHDLSSLTLDICGSDCPVSEHICEEIACVLPYIQHVRLRLTRICPRIFDMGKTVVRANNVRLRSMVLKLHLPMFAETNHLWASLCPQADVSREESRLFERMVGASQKFLADLAAIRGDVSANARRGDHGLTGFRISYPETTYPNVYTLDCLTMRRLFFPEDFFAYEDDGTPCWFELTEEGQRLMDGGQLLFSNARPVVHTRPAAPVMRVPRRRSA